MGRHSPESGLPLVSGHAARQYIGATWAIHAALRSITEEDRAILGPGCYELIVGGLATSGTLGGVFSPRQLALNSYHPGTFQSLSLEEASHIIQVGIRGGLLTTVEPPDRYALTREDLREHIVALYDWIPDLAALASAKYSV